MPVRCVNDGALTEVERVSFKRAALERGWTTQFRPDPIGLH